MSNLIYFPGDIVHDRAEIYEITKIVRSTEPITYQAIAVAFLRDMELEEWRTQIVPKPVEKLEIDLQKFDHPKPKYKLGERVRLKEFACFVRFIRYEHFAYYYSIMNIDYYGPIGGGWKEEESYLSKW